MMMIRYDQLMEDLGILTCGVWGLIGNRKLL